MLPLKLTRGSTRFWRGVSRAWPRISLALNPGYACYIVEVDGNKIPFAATEGEVLEIKPQ